jgi:hypothetical protein
MSPYSFSKSLSKKVVSCPYKDSSTLFICVGFRSAGKKVPHLRETSPAPRNF